MLNYTDLRKGTVFVLDGQPYQVMEYAFLRMQQRKPVAKTEIKNLMTGKIVERNFQGSDEFLEAELIRKPVKYIYNSRGEFWFTEVSDPSKRSSLKEDVVGAQGQFLKPNTEVAIVSFEDQTIGVEVPIKVDLAVKSTPPGERGNTAQSGTKTATLETGVDVQVPLFVNDSDVIRINTELGTYVERVEKAK